MSNSPQNSNSQQPESRRDGSVILAIVLIIVMGLLLIFGFEFVVEWLGRLFGM